MMIKYALTTAIALAASTANCDPAPTPIEPPPKLLCPAVITFVLLPHADSPTLCNLEEGQVLIYRMEDPGPIQEQRCLDSGGLMIDSRTGYLCFDIDY
jgi:hypothetical protein